LKNLRGQIITRAVESAQLVADADSRYHQFQTNLQLRQTDFMTIRTIAALLALAISYELNAQAISSKTELRPGYVKDSDIGCGCSFARSKMDLRNRRYIYSESMGEPAYINVTGKNLKLQAVASSGERIPEKVGQRSWETYTAKA
jgi:hypothetical protein